MKCPKCGAEINSTNNRCTRFPICTYIGETVKHDDIRNSSYIILDFETTGVKATDTIIEIGAIKVVNNQIIDQFSMLVNPGKNAYGEQIYINKNIENLTGIKNTDLIGQKSEVEAIGELIEWAKGFNTVVGQNIIRFDFRFLKNACREAKLLFPFTQVIDTLNVAGEKLQLKQKGYVKSLSQESLGNYYGFTYTAHRALDDVKALYTIFNFLLTTADENNVVILTQKV